MTNIADLSNIGISIVLGSYNRRKFLPLTIKTIREELDQSDIPYEIIVIDGGSTDGSIQWLIEQKDIITIIQHNRGEWRGKAITRRSWGYFINLGFKSAHGKYICMLSDDCLVIPGAIKQGYKVFENSLKNGDNTGAVAFYWRDWPIMERYSVHSFYGLINVNHGLFLREAIEKVGYADENTYNFYYGDVDLTFKLYNKGYSVIPSEKSFIEHYLHANISNLATNNLTQIIDQEAFLQKWQKISKDQIVVRWDAGERKRWLSYDDSYNTAHLFSPFNRIYKLSQYLKKMGRQLTSIIGIERIEKFQSETLKNYIKQSNNNFIKSLQFFHFSLSLDQDENYINTDNSIIE